MNHTTNINKHILFSFLLVLLFPNTAVFAKELTPVVLSKEFTVFEVKLKEVSFSGSDYHMITKDDGTVDYAAPHWQDNNADGDADDTGENKYPVSFVRGTKMQVSTRFFVNPSVNLGSIVVKVKGDGPGNLDFPESTAAFDGTDLLTSQIECSNPFANTISFFDPLEIIWKVSFDDGKTWVDAGISKNQLYVTLGSPVKIDTLYHTLVHIGCKNAAGQSAETATLDKIWEEFTDRDVRRVDGTQLTYYKSYKTQNVTTAALLKYGDGQCGAWANFFLDILKTQGIDFANEYVVFEHINAKTSFVKFLVKDWQFTGTGSSGNNEYSYLNIPEGNDPVRETSYAWKFAEVNDALGIPGQGNENPRSNFDNHQIVINGQYYDPSYGVKFSSLPEIDNNAIEGFYVVKQDYPVDEPAVNLDLNGDGDMVDNDVPTDYVYIIKKNPTGLDIKETRYNH